MCDCVGRHDDDCEDYRDKRDEQRSHSPRHPGVIELLKWLHCKSHRCGKINRAAILKLMDDYYLSRGFTPEERNLFL